jgi:hypothetical protein
MWRGIFRDHRITKEREREKQAAPEEVIQEQTKETDFRPPTIPTYAPIVILHINTKYQTVHKHS